MRQRVRFGAGLVVLSILIYLVVLQGSFTVGDYGPSTPEQTYVFWGLSTLTFLLTVLLAFMLFRDAVKLYFARRAGVEGSRIRTKMLVGALSLTFLPTIFLVLWSVSVLNRNLDKWFSRPAEIMKLNMQEISAVVDREANGRLQASARWVADSEDLRSFLKTGHVPAEFFTSVCDLAGADRAYVHRADGGQISICQSNPDPKAGQPEKGGPVKATAPIDGVGEVVIEARLPLDLVQRKKEMDQQVSDYDRLASGRKETRRFYLQLLVLITIFILFIAVWVALFLARQISSPVAALLEAARAVRGGNLSYRVKVEATDELASLVRAFNEMTQDLQANQDELERRRRFIEAVLQSIPTGVFSLTHDGTVQLVNGALSRIFPDGRVQPGRKLVDLMPRDRQEEFSRLLKRARRTGTADRQVEIRTEDGVRHFSVTAAALEASVTSGFVVVVEDTSELMRAQRAAAWHEVARRIAHELKNPLTPIALSSERILRQLDKTAAPPEVRRIVTECCATIGREVESVKTLVDEFARFARFPAAHPAPADLNAVVEEGLAVFHGRLEDISIHVSLSSLLPMVALDRDQFKRVIVNLVDNAAEAMAESPLRHLFIETHAVSPELVELMIADTGCGITTDDKEKLFLPYFSTKQRGTGLGLAIVSHIVAEHHARIRVEDNNPVGARFIIEIPAIASAEFDARPVEVRA
ncbi:sensor histidine kinase [Paludibaculum fermentans]|uniref:histidine kinase n=1 Tax=Paludibaculum fermentans TaxID=1473598 RepID=A0A7S7NKR8_PALFE|nr:ATP-binding protein [Paludibaculum fermentans]QOY84914.1 HAMP domain-containing protein [Paludibaculum fermentans]